MRSISGFLAAGAAASELAGWPSGGDGRGLHAVGGHHVDPVLHEVRVQVADLLLGHLDLLETPGDLLEGQVAALLALGDQRAQLLDLEERRLGLLGQ